MLFYNASPNTARKPMAMAPVPYSRAAESAMAAALEVVDAVLELVLELPAPEVLLAVESADEEEAAPARAEAFFFPQTKD
jgi:hypothetical protein